VFEGRYDDIIMWQERQDVHNAVDNTASRLDPRLAPGDGIADLSHGQALATRCSKTASAFLLMVLMKR
jgi:hypothetical protein